MPRGAFAHEAAKRTKAATDMAVVVNRMAETCQNTASIAKNCHFHSPKNRVGPHQDLSARALTNRHPAVAKIKSANPPRNHPLCPSIADFPIVNTATA
jgi:hypothetical protein